MRKKQLLITKPLTSYYQLVIKFKNLLTWVDNLIFTGRFREFTLKQQQKVVAKLRALYTKLSAINHPMALKVAGAATCFLLFAGTAKAQTASFNKLTGTASPINFTNIAGMHTASGDYCRVMDGSFADIDGDGDQDLVVLAQSQYETKIAFFENVNGQYIENSNDNPFANCFADYSIDVLDVDGDENLDIVFTYDGSGSRINHFEFNAASGDFESVTVSGVIEKRYALRGIVDNLNIKFLDVNADGLPDMVCSGIKDGNNYIGTFFQNADHSFGDIQDNVPIQASQMPEGQYQMAVADMDRDGDEDLTIYAPYAVGYCSYFANNGNGTFTQITEVGNIPLPIAQLSQKSVIIPGDIDNDNQTDIFQPGNQWEDVFYNEQAVYINTTIPVPVATNDYLVLYFDNYPYIVTPAMVLANDDLNNTKGTLVAKFISSTNGGTITANGINYYDTLTTEGYHSVIYRVGNALAPGDTVWGNTTEADVFPVPLQVAMVSDSTGDLSVDLVFNTNINYSAYARYGINTIGLVSPSSKRGSITLTLPNYTAGDTIKIYGYGITYFNADSIQLNYLDVSRCRSLGGLSCCSNHLTHLDVSQNTNLYKFSCSYNFIDTLYLPLVGNDGSELDFDHNRLKNLALPDSAATLNVSYNLLDTLDISHVTGLSSLICSFNNLKQLTLGTSYDLEYLVCDHNQLTLLNVNDVPNLMALDCQNNQLHWLNVDNKPNLFYLYCQNNRFRLGQLPQNKSQYIADPTYGIGGYKYAPQAPILVGYDDYNRVDLYYEFALSDASDEVHFTEFTWITTTGDTLVEGTDYFMNEGRFTFFTNLTDSIYCTLYNAALPQLHGDSILRTVNIMPPVAQLTKTMVSQANGNLLFGYVDYAGEFFIDYGSGIKQITSDVMYKSGVENGVEDLSKASYDDSYTIDNYIAGTPIKIYGPGLGRLYLDSLSLTELNVSHLTGLYRIYCSNNLLTQLDISNNNELYILDCSNNNLNFATLPWVGYLENNVRKADSEAPYIYTPQDNLSTIVNNGQVDLSNQLSAYDADSVLYTTSYTWFTKDGTQLISNYYTENNGQFQFIQTPADSVYCVLANAAFPAFTGDSVLRTALLKVEKMRYLPVIAWNDPESIVYGTALSLSQLNAEALFENNSVPGLFQYLPDIDSVLNAGNSHPLSVVFVPADTNAYFSVTANVFIDVTKADLTVTADNKERYLGAENPVFTFTYDGFVNNDLASVLDVEPTVSTLATSESKVGEYAITVSGGHDNNYDFTYVNGILTINDNPDDPELTVSVSELSIASQASSTVTFDITSNIDWEISSSESWLHINPEQGNGNKTISLAADQNSTSGYRQAIITIKGKGVDDIIIMVTQDAFLSILESTPFVINVYPNPGNERVNILLPYNFGNATLEIYNISGAKLHQLNLEQNENYIDVTSLDQGVYVFCISVDGQSKKLRWIKK